MFDLKLLNIFLDEECFESKNVCLSTDTRSYSKEEVFFCLCGENFDGFDYVEDVLNKGCEVVIYKCSQKNTSKMKKLSLEFENVTFISVDSPLLALQELAKERIKEFKNNGGRVFGITGSNGKTTTKEMLTDLLKAAFGELVYSTKGNFNNHIGVPLTILAASKNCQYLVVEMGANHVGEIQNLCEIAQPEFGIISSIGAAHIGLFGNIENIVKEKSSLFNYVVKNGSDDSLFVVNGDDKYLKELSSPKLIKFGEDSTIKIQYLEEEIKIDDSITLKNSNIQEKYNQGNLISALLLCVKAFPELTDVFIRAANRFTIPSLNRSEWITKNNKLIFLDAYNANPTSMESSLRSFTANINKKNISLSNTLFILGDMNELGNYTLDEHKKIGLLLNELNAIHVVFVGNYSKHYQLGFSAGLVYLEKSLLESEWTNLIKDNSTIFIKASRSLQLESLIDIT